MNANHIDKRCGRCVDIRDLSQIRIWMEILHLIYKWTKVILFQPNLELSKLKASQGPNILC